MHFDAVFNRQNLGTRILRFNRKVYKKQCKNYPKIHCKTKISGVSRGDHTIAPGYTTDLDTVLSGVSRGDHTIAPGYTTDLEHCVKISGVSRGDHTIAPGYTTDLDAVLKVSPFDDLRYVFVGNVSGVSSVVYGIRTVRQRQHTLTLVEAELTYHGRLESRFTFYTPHVSTIAGM